MQVLIAIALKSLLIAGLTLGLLQLLGKRSAAERSWVAHIGLFALVILAIAPIILPSWNIEAPALMGHAADVTASVQAPASAAVPPATSAPIASTASAVAVPHGVSLPSLSAAAALTAAYALPAAILLFITLLAAALMVSTRPCGGCSRTGTG